MKARSLITPVAVVLSILSPHLFAAEFGSAFTFQGRLADGPWRDGRNKFGVFPRR
ncbi:MAG TPA: hypothetical protein VJA21_30745 [Verrucomicrobiae bacterium]